MTDECRRILVDISAYLDGELAAPSCETIERHCRQCPECATLVAGLRETVGLCRHAAAAPLPESVRARARDGVRQLLDAEPQRHRENERRRRAVEDQR
jgi:anti-sigma factor RsiW